MLPVQAAYWGLLWWSVFVYAADLKGVWVAEPPKSRGVQEGVALPASACKCAIQSSPTHVAICLQLAWPVMHTHVQSGSKLMQAEHGSRS